MQQLAGQALLASAEGLAAHRELRDRQHWLDGQRRALEAAINGAPLETSLGILVNTAVEAVGFGARAAFFLANAEGTTLHHLVGMPPEYAQAMDGFPIGPDSLACGLATATGRPRLTPDVRGDPLWQPWLWIAEKFDYRGCWSFPVHSRHGSFCGTLAIYSRAPREATEREIEIASLLTRTASILVSQQKESEARRRGEQLEAEQNRVLEMIATGRPLGECLVALTGSISRLQVGARAVVLIADAGRSAMAHAHSANIAPAFGASLVGAPIEEFAMGACSVAVFKGEPIACADVANDTRWAVPWRDLCLANGIRAGYSMPIFGPTGGAVASFFLTLDEARAPNRWEVRIAEFGARVAGIALERDRSERALRESRAQLQADLDDSELLQRLSAMLVEQEKVEDLYEKIIDAAMAIMRSDFASMQMLYPERGDAGELRLLACRGFTEQAVGFWEWVDVDSESSCGESLRRRTRVVLPDVECGRYKVGSADLAAYRQVGIRSAQTTPLISRGGELLGMISTHWNRPHRPSDRSLRLLDILARQAADLVERARTERLLAHQRRLYEGVLSTTPDLAYVFGLDHRFVYANEALLSMWGKSRDDAIGRNCLELGYEPWHAQMHDREIDEVVATRQPIRGVIPFTGTSGRRLYDYIFTPVIGADGGIQAVAGTARDVTDIKQNEQALRESEERNRMAAGALREADRRKDEFLAMLGHELRNPLAPVRNAVHVLRLKAPHEPELRWSCDVIERQVRHLTRLIDDLLDVSRIAHDKLELRRQRVALTDVVEAAAEASRPNIERRGHEFTVTLPQEAIYLDGDLVRLTQVFVNLLNNAAAYTDRGGRIWLSAEASTEPRESPQLIVKVRDSGVGIPVESIARMFELFYQADDAQTRARSGLGIGLSLARRLVEMHGGSIEVYSDGVGQGSEFSVRLPIRVDGPAGTPSREASAAAGSMPTAVRRILVVDDNRDVADSLATLLKLSGNEVRIAYDGLQGVETAQRFAPDVVLLDIAMPVLDGEEACRRIRKQTWGTSIVLIALTGRGREEDSLRIAEAGFDAHMVKPVDPAALLDFLERHTADFRC